MSKKLIKRNGKWYTEDGKLFIGTGYINGKLYHFNSDGTKTLWYRGRPAENIKLLFKGVYAGPKRMRANNSPTSKDSLRIEDKMRTSILTDELDYGASNPKYDIPFIPKKAIIINGNTTSTNVLDSLAKYAGMHNANPQLSVHPMLKRSKYTTPRQINRDEMLGLAGLETHFGAQPVYNTSGQSKAELRSLLNSNYLTAFGYIPAERLVRNFLYNDTKVDRKIPPLLDAFLYYAQGDYNRGDPNHTSDVNKVGRNIWNNPKVQQWWNESGQYWYKLGQKAAKHQQGGTL